jgi:D-arabinose 1-dehydrogenase-like Zn-dependent alcohol dehydrogenase
MSVGSNLRNVFSWIRVVRQVPDQKIRTARVLGNSGVPVKVQLPIFETVLNGITIKGSIVGNRADLAEVFELHAAGRTKVSRETRKLEEVNEAFEEVERGKARARLVFDFR